jgi:hypothetical protein
MLDFFGDNRERLRLRLRLRNPIRRRRRKRRRSRLTHAYFGRGEQLKRFYPNSNYGFTRTPITVLSERLFRI